MPNFSTILKSEIIRLSKKEIKAAVQPLKSANVSLKKTVAELKKRVSALESENKRLLLQQPEKKVQQSPELPDNIRVSSKTIISLRKKLGLSQGAFGKLLGVSSNAVFSMEHKTGRLRLRSATLSAFLEIRDMGKREVMKKLETMEN